MTPSRDSIEARILQRLYAMPKAVRGVSEVMLMREFGAPAAIRALSEAGLIRSRGWEQLRHRVPGSMWLLTEAGERLCGELWPGVATTGPESGEYRGN